MLPFLRKRDPGFRCVRTGLEDLWRFTSVREPQVIGTCLTHERRADNATPCPSRERPVRLTCPAHRKTANLLLGSDRDQIRIPRVSAEIVNFAASGSIF